MIYIYILGKRRSRRKGKLRKKRKPRSVEAREEEKVKRLLFLHQIWAQINKFGSFKHPR